MRAFYLVLCGLAVATVASPRRENEKQGVDQEVSITRPSEITEESDEEVDRHLRPTRAALSPFGWLTTTRKLGSDSSDSEAKNKAKPTKKPKKQKNSSSSSGSGEKKKPQKKPGKKPVKLPSPTPTQKPSTQWPTQPSVQKQSSLPTQQPTQPSTQKPTPPPTQQPTPAPTQKPAPPPTQEPTPAPIQQTTPLPTPQPTQPSTQKPTSPPTQQPTPAPTQKPAPPPTQQPTPRPTQKPSPPPAPPTQQPSVPAPEVLETSKPRQVVISFVLPSGLQAPQVKIPPGSPTPILVLPVSFNNFSGQNEDNSSYTQRPAPTQSVQVQSSSQITTQSSQITRLPPASSRPQNPDIPNPLKPTPPQSGKWVWISDTAALHTAISTTGQNNPSLTPQSVNNPRQSPLWPQYNPNVRQPTLPQTGTWVWVPHQPGASINAASPVPPSSNPILSGINSNFPSGVAQSSQSQGAWNPISNPSFTRALQLLISRVPQPPVAAQPGNPAPQTSPNVNNPQSLQPRSGKWVWVPHQPDTPINAERPVLPSYSNQILPDINSNFPSGVAQSPQSQWAWNQVSNPSFTRALQLQISRVPQQPVAAQPGSAAPQTSPNVNNPQSLQPRSGKWVWAPHQPEAPINAASSVPPSSNPVLPGINSNYPGVAQYPQSQWVSNPGSNPSSISEVQLQISSVPQATVAAQPGNGLPQTGPNVNNPQSLQPQSGKWVWVPHGTVVNSSPLGSSSPSSSPCPQSPGSPVNYSSTPQPSSSNSRPRDSPPPGQQQSLAQRQVLPDALTRSVQSHACGSQSPSAQVIPPQAQNYGLQTPLWAK